MQERISSGQRAKNFDDCQQFLAINCCPGVDLKFYFMGRTMAGLWVVVALIIHLFPPQSIAFIIENVRLENVLFSQLSTLLFNQQLALKFNEIAVDFDP